MITGNIFFIFAPNIDCRCSLEPTIYVLNKSKKNNKYPANPTFSYVKCGIRGYP